MAGSGWGPFLEQRRPHLLGAWWDGQLPSSAPGQVLKPFQSTSFILSRALPLGPLARLPQIHPPSSPRPGQGMLTSASRKALLEADQTQRRQG